MYGTVLSGYYVPYTYVVPYLLIHELCLIFFFLNLVQHPIVLQVRMST